MTDNRAIEQEPTLWDKLDVDAYLSWQEEINSERQAERQPKVELTTWGKRRRKAKLFVMDFIGVTVWLYAFIKIFVGDVDRWVVNNLWPSLLWLVDFRFFVLLAGATVLVLLLRRWELAGWLLYVLFFPLILLIWKIPRFFYRQKSWTLVIGTMQVAWTVVRSFRFGFLTVSATLFCLLAVAISNSELIMYGVVITALLIWSMVLGRAVVAAPRPSSFVRAQQQGVCKLLDSKWAWGLSVPDPAIKSHGVERLDKTQADMLIQRASMGVVLYGTGHVCAEELEQYRKSGASVVFTAISVVALVMQGLLFFALANIALYNIDPNQYTFSEAPGFATFARYSLAALTIGEIEAVQASGGIASLLSIYAGVSLAIIALILVVAVVFGIRQSRDDEVARNAIEQIRSRSDEFARKLTDEYRISVADLVKRLLMLGGFVGMWLRVAGDTVDRVRGFESWRDSTS